MEITKNSIICSGCHACYSVCPMHCIEMKPNIEGFLYPKVDKCNCIQCGKCKKVCPLNSNDTPKTNNIAYVAKNVDEAVRLLSSSGGAFSIIATYILMLGGVVYGASFDDDYKVVHKRIDSIDNLQELYGSKYVQSTIGDSYINAKCDLESGKTVLFTGTPCQIKGIKAFLNKDYANLYLQDIICHGVPSPVLWKKYLESICDSPSYVSFRDKKTGWSNYSFTVNDFSEKFRENKYMSLFLGNVSLRESCYSCKAKGISRVSDITLADYWGCEKEEPRIYDDKGVSLIITHSEKGEKLKSIIEECSICKKTNLQKALSHNLSAIESSKKSNKRDRYLSLISDNSFESINSELQKIKNSNSIIKRLKYYINLVIGKCKVFLIKT